MRIDDDTSNPYYEEPIGYSESLKKMDAAVFKECILSQLNSDDEEKYAGTRQQQNDQGENNINSDSKKSHTFGRRTRLEGGENSSPDRELVNRLNQGNEYYKQDLLDKNSAENKKKLLYDKQLKAYYDPESGQYFQMKAQLMDEAGTK